MPSRKRTIFDPVYSIVKQLAYAVVLIVWWCVGLPVTLPILLIVYILYVLVSSTTSVIQYFTGRTTETRLTPGELALYNKVGSNAVVQSLLFLSSPIALDRLREKVKSEIVNENCSKMTQNLLRCLRFNGVPSWKDVAGFDVTDHVFQAEVVFNSETDIRNYVSKCSSESLEASRPLWEIRSCSYLDQGFLLVRFHPCVMSGRTALRFLCNNLADTPFNYTSQHLFPWCSSVNKALGKWLTFPLGLISSNNNSAHANKSREKYFSEDRDFTAMCHGTRSCAWSEAVHLPSLKHSVAVMRTTVSAVTLSALASAFRLVPNNFNNAESFPVKLIYDISNHEKSKSHRPEYRESCIPSPCKIEGAIPCLWSIRRSLAALKESIYPCLFRTVLDILGVFCCFSVYVKLLSSSVKQRALYAFTSLSGPTATLYICGRRVQSISTWYPGVSDVALTATVMTYADEMRICLQSWENSGLDIQRLTAECKKQLEILIEQLKHRQVPKKKRLYYEDGDADEFDTPYEDDDDVAPAPSTRPGSKLFFQRTKIHFSNGNVNNAAAIDTVSRRDDVESGTHKVNSATEPQDIVFSQIDQSPSARAMDTHTRKMSRTDLEVGLDISPVVERRGSTSLL